MPEAFLILLCGGVLLATAIPKPRDVTLHWLRLGGMIALTMLGLSAFFWTRRTEGAYTAIGGYLGISAMVLIQLALVQVALPEMARFAALIAFLVSAPLAVDLIGRRIDVPYGAAVVGCAGVAALSGLVLMEMLLGHAYLTASQMSMAPFVRMNLVLAGVLLLRIFFLLCASLMEQRWPMEMFWQRQAFLVAVRLLVGLMIPCVFVYMTHDCIKRRSTQSATGILYVTGVLVFIGEMVALYLTKETGLPF